jgi:hypothetical protein
LPLHIQKGLVDEGKAIPDTAAGEELNKELDAQIERHREENAGAQRGFGAGGNWAWKSRGCK